MPQYMLLLYDNKDKSMSPVVNPEDMRRVLQKYLDWRKKPFIVDGRRLADDPGKVVRAATTTDGPYSETKEILGGYYTINAANYDEALAITMTNPHLEYGGTIELRELFPPPPQ